MIFSTTNWDAVSAIGTLLGAIATSFAVIVALFQPIIANHKKLRLRVGDNYRIAGGPFSEESEPYIVVFATNIGSRKIVINTWGIELSKKQSYIFIADINAEIQTTTPVTIMPGEETQFCLKRVHLINALLNEQKKKRLKGKKKIKIILVDNAGKRFKVKTCHTAGEYCTMKAEK